MVVGGFAVWLRIGRVHRVTADIDTVARDATQLVELLVAGAGGRVGEEPECPLCDRAEMPSGLVVVRTAGPWDPATPPAGLRRAHTVAAGTWGSLRLLEGPSLSRCRRLLGVHWVGARLRRSRPRYGMRLSLGERGSIEVDFLTRG
jgi:hypothetical protein